MRYITIIIISISFLSCNQKHDNSESKQKDYLTQWFLKNEDSLFMDFSNQVQGIKGQTNWLGGTFHNEDTTNFVGKFTFQAKKYCDNLDVSFIYDNRNAPHMQTLISASYNRKYTKALDSLFNPIPTSTYFYIQKYEQPSIRLDSLALFQELNLQSNDLRVSFTPVDSLFNVSVFLFSGTKKIELSDADKELLKKKLFGEELLLKKINEVTFIPVDKITPNLLTLNQIRTKLK